MSRGREGKLNWSGEQSLSTGVRHLKTAAVLYYGRFTHTRFWKLSKPRRPFWGVLGVCVGPGPGAFGCRHGDPTALWRWDIASLCAHRCLRLTAGRFSTRDDKNIYIKRVLTNSVSIAESTASQRTLLPKELILILPIITTISTLRLTHLREDLLPTRPDSPRVC